MYPVSLRLSVAALISTALPAAGQLVVQQARWGFDGRVVPCRVNLLSVLVANPGAGAFDGAMTLRKSIGMGARDAPIVEPCYVAAGTERWVQLYPYVGSEQEAWTLVWGPRGDDRLDLPEVKFGPPATVLLADPDDPFPGNAGMKLFPVGLFPPSVGATDGLHAVLLDHVPRWEPARREAFRDWVRCGGTVHVLRDREGKFPAFEGDFASSEERFRVGAGLVVRHDATRREAGDAFLASRGFPSPRQIPGSEIVLYKPEDVFFQRLDRLTRVEHMWPVIYWLAIVYLVLVGPIHWLYARKPKRDYRLSIGVFLATVAAFAGLFHVVGRRGYGESTVVHALSWARPVGPGVHDVTQWANVFVTSGDLYTLAHDAPHAIYAACQDMEAVNGVIRNGRGGSFAADIPLYSKRPYLFRGRLKGDDPSVRVAAWEGEGKLTKLELETGPGFPAETLEMWVLSGTSFRPMRREGTKLVLGSTERIDSEQFLATDAIGADGVQYGGGYGGGNDGPGTPDAAFRMLARLAIARALGGTKAFAQTIRPGKKPGSPAEEPDTPLPPPGETGPGRARLFILARAPASFAPAKGVPGRTVGGVLYDLVIEKP